MSWPRNLSVGDVVKPVGPVASGFAVACPGAGACAGWPEAGAAGCCDALTTTASTRATTAGARSPIAREARGLVLIGVQCRRSSGSLSQLANANVPVLHEPFEPWRVGRLHADRSGFLPLRFRRVRWIVVDV